MASEQLVETIYGKFNVYRIYRTSNWLGDARFRVYKDKAFYGAFTTLPAAIASAKRDGRVA